MAIAPVRTSTEARHFCRRTVNFVTGWRRCPSPEASRSADTTAEADVETHSMTIHASSN